MLWVLVGLALALSALSLRRGRVNVAAPPLPEWPAVTLIVPVKGEDEGLRENLAALAALDYPDFELIVCARSAEDVPVGVVPAGARLVYAGAGDPNTGEKIRNLLAAVDAARGESTVFAFADSDARPLQGWLKALVAELADPAVGVATGYRWYLPERGFWSELRAAWNAVIAGGFMEGSPRFCWGGAMAVRRETFEKLRVREHWLGHVSDDYRMAQAVRDAGMGIAFAPGALTPARDHTTAREFFEWTRRQMLLTRVYRPDLWWLALVAHIVYCGGMAAAVWLAAGGSSPAAAAFAVQIGAGMVKARRRLRWASGTLGEPAGGAAQLWLTPVATWAWLYSLMASAFGRVIIWRGARYELRTQGFNNGSGKQEF